MTAETDPPGSRADGGPIGSGERPERPVPGPDGASDARVTDLAGRTILITRAPERAKGLKARLESLGATVLTAPLTTTEPADPADLDAAVKSLTGPGAAGRSRSAYDWVFVTSVNAVEALAAAAGRAEVALGQAPVKWAAVGPATAKALASAGVEAAAVPDKDHSAAGLVSLFATANHPPDRALLPQGDLAGPTLAEGLRAMGWTVDTVVAYRTVPHPLPPDILANWRDGAIDLALLAAGSAARELAAQLGPDAARVPVVAIGEPSARAAREAGLRLAAVAAQATDDAVVLALESAVR